MPRLLILAAVLIAAVSWAGTEVKPFAPTVATLRVPEDGIQPQVIEKDGVVHLLYFTGDAAGGDLHYVRSRDYGRTFSKPIRVNSQPGSAMATGNIRGGQLALGANGQVHVAWIGSGSAQPRGASNSAPVLYTRLNSARTEFAPERSLGQSSWGADGGTVAADSNNNVYVFWHAQPPGGKGEDTRRLWMAKSSDGGVNFAGETAINDVSTGVCGCCGSRALASADGSLYVLFRSASQMVNRDIWLLSSRDRGASFHGTDVSHWNVGVCVMSSAALLPVRDGILAAWESEKQVYFGRVPSGSGTVQASTGAPGTGNNRKYPVLATNGRGETLFAWTEYMAWNKGGSVAWQAYGRDLKPQGSPGNGDGVPKWSLVAAFARPDNSFVVVY